MPVQQLLKLRHKCCGVRGLYSAHLLRCTLRLPLHRWLLRLCCDGLHRWQQPRMAPTSQQPTKAVTVPPGLTLSTLTTPQMYCVLDKAADSLSTADHVCSKTSKGRDSCEIMCSGWGYATTLVSPSVSVSAHSTGAVWCRQGVQKHCGSPYLARPPGRQSGWARPERINISLIPWLHTSWLKSTRSLRVHLPLHLNSELLHFLFKNLEGNPGGVWCPDWFLSPGKTLTGILRNWPAPWHPLWKWEGRVEVVEVFRMT